MELPKDGAFALLTAFHFTKLLHSNLTPAEFAALSQNSQKDAWTRPRVRHQPPDDQVRQIGKPKEGIERDLQAYPRSCEAEF